MDWTTIFAERMSRMKASEIRELLKLLDQPDIISFAGGIPDPALFPTQAFQAAFADALSAATQAPNLRPPRRKSVSSRVRRLAHTPMANITPM